MLALGRFLLLDGLILDSFCSRPKATQARSRRERSQRIASVHTLGRNTLGWLRRIVSPYRSRAPHEGALRAGRHVASRRACACCQSCCACCGPVHDREGLKHALASACRRAPGPLLTRCSLQTRRGGELGAQEPENDLVKIYSGDLPAPARISHCGPPSSGLKLVLVARCSCELREDGHPLPEPLAELGFHGRAGHALETSDLGGQVRSGESGFGLEEGRLLVRKGRGMGCGWWERRPSRASGPLA
jgi:hypothetical protein